MNTSILTVAHTTSVHDRKAAVVQTPMCEFWDIVSTCIPARTHGHGESHIALHTCFTSARAAAIIWVTGTTEDENKPNYNDNPQQMATADHEDVVGRRYMLLGALQAADAVALSNQQRRGPPTTSVGLDTRTLRDPATIGGRLHLRASQLGGLDTDGGNMPRCAEPTRQCAGRGEFDGAREDPPPNTNWVYNVDGREVAETIGHEHADDHRRQVRNLLQRRRLVTDSEERKQLSKEVCAVKRAAKKARRTAAIAQAP